MHRLNRFPRIVFIACTLATLACAGTIVAPGSDTSSEANNNNGFPFNLSNLGASSMRYQQVYDASNFSTVGGAILITAIDFRPDASTGGAFSSTLSNVRIDLSTTAVTPGSLSSTFASNVGANDAVVFSGALSLSSAFTGPAGGPKAFDIVITLATPFLYNPANGSLLLDVRNFGGGATTQFDSDSLSSSVARVWATDSGATTGTLNSNGNGLVTQFVFSSASVPEPSTLSLMGLMAFGVVAARLRRRK